MIERAEDHTEDDSSPTNSAGTSDRDAITVLADVPARSATTFGVGGLLAKVIEPASVVALSKIMRRMSEAGETVRILGAGSNLIIDDNGIREPVLRLPRAFSGWQEIGGGAETRDSNGTTSAPEMDGETLSLDIDRVERIRSEISSRSEGSAAREPDRVSRWFVLGGTSLMALSRRLTAEGWSGLEFAAGIPGSFGGAVFMNAGAHGCQLGDIIRSVVVVDRCGSIRRIGRSDLELRYRCSGIPRGSVVVGATIDLVAADPTETGKKRAECLEYRRATQPLHLPSAGSVFRNPPAGTIPLQHPSSADSKGGSCSAGWLLERAGMKGMISGGVAFSTLHANWLVRISDDARGEDARYLIERAKTRVFEEFGISLEPEIVLW